MWTIRLRKFNRDLTPAKRDRSESTLYVHWHEDILLLSLKWAFSKICTMASRSKDGELIARALTFLGYRMIRGSSRHFGAETFEELCLAFDHGYDLALAVDGPKGPRHEVKNGALWIAFKKKIKIVPVVANAKYRFTFHKSWDKMWVPIPFSSAVMIFGEAIFFDGTESPEILQQKRLQIQESLKHLKAIALNYYA